ncbi:hypothetical protein Q7P35_010810 [Cladosporium inversicolor]
MISVAVVGRWADKLTRSVAFSALTQLSSVPRYVVVVDISCLSGPRNKSGIQHTSLTHSLVDISVVVHTDLPEVWQGSVLQKTPQVSVLFPSERPTIVRPVPNRPPVGHPVVSPDDAQKLKTL